MRDHALCNVFDSLSIDDRRCTGMPAHAAYEQLGHQSSCDEEAEDHQKSDVAYQSLAPDSYPAQAGYTAAHDSMESNGHAHIPSAPLDCQSAQVHASACESSNRSDTDSYQMCVLTQFQALHLEGYFKLAPARSAGSIVAPFLHTQL